jgi:microcin C transport system permease protein
MTMRAIGFLFMLLGSLAALGEVHGIAFPTAQWFFEASRTVPFLNFTMPGGQIFPWFGWMSVASLIIGGICMTVRTFTRGPKNPITERQIQRFREIKRGYYSLMILILLGGVAGLDQLVVGKRALAVKYDGHWIFPAFLSRELKNKDFGITGERAEAAADYRELKRLWKETNENRVIMPLVPYDSTGDTLPPRSRPLVERDGIYYELGSSKPYWGLAARYHDILTAKIHLRQAMREGKLMGPQDGWDASGLPVFNADLKNDGQVSERFSGAGTKQQFLTLPSTGYRAIKYHPAPPIPSEGNWLGTTSQGYDMLAYLYGGLQVNFKAALIYLPFVYVIGISIGMMMGYFGGWFDLIMQRMIEIFSNTPFLFIVIIFSSMVPERFKGLPVILTILIIFGWMGLTYLMRTAAYRDKERDYIAAAKVLGASTPRIIFRHLLPNTVAIIVTLLPFTVSGLVFSLTSLDYLGFGLPPEYATWGRLLNDGLANLSSPWLVTSTFIVLVGLLVLITFIGEAVREAFDPKKFTYYR